MGFAHFTESSCHIAKEFLEQNDGLYKGAINYNGNTFEVKYLKWYVIMNQTITPAIVPVNPDLPHEFFDLQNKDPVASGFSTELMSKQFPKEIVKSCNGMSLEMKDVVITQEAVHDRKSSYQLIGSQYFKLALFKYHEVNKMDYFDLIRTSTEIVQIYMIEENSLIDLPYQLSFDVCKSAPNLIHYNGACRSLEYLTNTLHARIEEFDTLDIYHFGKIKNKGKEATPIGPILGFLTITLIVIALFIIKQIICKGGKQNSCRSSYRKLKERSNSSTTIVI